MGGEIAQVIATADIPVVLKDVEQEFVDHGLDKAREVTKASLDRLVAKEKLTQEQADARLEEVMGRIHGTTDYDGLRRRRLRHRGRARADGDQAGRVRRARRRHPRPRDPRLQHLVAVDHRDGRGDQPARQGRRLSLLLPGLGDAADRGHRGRRHLRPRPCRPRPTSPRRSASSRSRCGEVPGFVVNRILNSAVGEIWREQEEKGSRSRRSTRGSRRRRPRRWARSSSATCSASTPCVHVAEHLQESYGDRFYVHKGHEGAGRGGQPRREDREGLL